MMLIHLAKWTQTLKIQWANLLAYKINFLMISIAPAVVFYFIKYNLWSSIYELSGQSLINGYDLKRMLTYQLWILIVVLLGQGHNGVNISMDIRMGRISSYLIYPFQFWQFHSAGFLAYQSVQLFIAALTITTITLLGFVEFTSFILIFKGVLLTCLVSLLWFAFQYLIGLMAFWLDETWVIRVLLLQLSVFLSGSFLPLEFYPKWLTEILIYTPFPYMSHIPVKILMGEYQGSLLSACGFLGIWIIVIFTLAHLIWKKGLKLYTAAGM